MAAAATKFQIFTDDQENLTEKPLLNVVDTKCERQKLGPLTNKPINNENAFEKQTLKLQKASTSTSTIGGAFKQKNIFTSADEPLLKQKIHQEVYSEENSIINVTNDSLGGQLEESSTSFTFRSTVLNEIQKNGFENSFATPMSVEATTPMSIDKSTMEIEHDIKIVIRNDRDRFFDVIEYQKDILEYLKQVEVQKNIRPRADYMKKQPDINDSMRTILVDWLVEVSEEYRLHGETLCLAVNYIDRFLSFMSVVRAKLQLVGTAAMFIASKYEEIYPPEIGEFVYITDDTYTKQQVLRMEKLLLKVLSFDLCAPSMLSFINLFTSMINIPEKIKFLAQYLCELSLLRASPFLEYTPSQVSAAALALAHYTLGTSIWSKKMQDTFGYTIDDLKDIIVHLSNTHHEAEAMQQQAIQDKYKNIKYMKVSTVPPKKITVEDIDEITAEGGCDLNSTAENIESVRQKTELLFN